MKRRVLIVLSALAMVAVSVLWLLSWLSPFAYARCLADEDTWVEIGLVDGNLDILVLHGVCRDPYRQESHTVFAVDFLKGRYGISEIHAQLGFRPPPGIQSRWFILPLWLLYVLAFVLPASAYVQGPMRHRWRRARGLCAFCGYNLTGNVSGVCPECGERV